MIFLTRTYKKRKKCAVCNSNLQNVLELGKVPLAGYFPKKGEDDKKIYDLNLMVCPNCGLVQTDSIINPDVLFKDYRYSSSVSLSGYFKDVAKYLYDKLELRDKTVLEIGCNDGVLMEPLEKLEVNIVGIDPAKNIVDLAEEKGLEVELGYFNYRKAKSLGWGGLFDVVIANNTFAHISDIRSVLRGINYVLDSDGIFVFEVHYLKNLVELKQWDNVYHEHIFYYSVTAIQNFMKEFEMTLVDFEEIPTHSGSIRFYVKNGRLNQPDWQKFMISTEYKKIKKTIEDEKLLYKELFTFKKMTNDHINSIKSFISELKAKNKKIIGYGSSGRANMFCNIVGLTNNEIDYIVDESPERYGRIIPSMNIPIVSRDEMKYDADYVFIFAWNYSKMIMEKLKDHNFKYIVAFPDIQVVNNYEELKIKIGL